jgi:hypothetical protein
VYLLDQRTLVLVHWFSSCVAKCTESAPLGQRNLPFQ